MKMKTIHIAHEVSSHPMGCIEEDGIMCKYLYLSRASGWRCRLFETPYGASTRLRDMDGNVEKCTDCKRCDVKGVSRSYLFG